MMFFIPDTPENKVMRTGLIAFFIYLVSLILFDPLPITNPFIKLPKSDPLIKFSRSAYYAI